VLMAVILNSEGALSQLICVAINAKQVNNARALQ